MHRVPKPASGSKSAGGTKGKADSSKSSAARRVASVGPQDRVLLSPCRGVVQTKIKGALKRRRYYTKLRLSAPKFEQLTKIVDQQFPLVKAMHGDWLDSAVSLAEDADRSPDLEVPNHTIDEPCLAVFASSSSSIPIYLLDGL